MDIKVIGCEAWLNEHEKKAKVDIAQSTVSSMTMEELLALDGEEGQSFYETLNKEVMNYGWIEGSPTFKREVAKLYKKEISDNNIIQTNGCTGANWNAMMSILEPGDHVIAEWPSYAPLYELPRTLGCEVEYWEIREDLGWRPDIEDLKKLIRPNTKMIALCNASNPIGCILDKKTLEEVAELAASVGAYVLCDEVYLPLENTENFASMIELYDKAIVTNSISKTYSFPGARIGWVIAPDEVSDKIRTYRDYTQICSGVFNDSIAVFVLQHKDQILERNRKIVFHNRAIVDEWIANEPRATWKRPEGVSVSFMRLDIPIDDEAFCLKILEEDGLLLIPGSRFELPKGARLGYCADEDTLRTGLDLLSKQLAKFDA